MKDQELLTIQEAAQEKRLSRATIARAIKSGELTVFRFGRAVRIDRTDLEAWQASKRDHRKAA